MKKSFFIFTTSLLFLLSVMSSHAQTNGGSLDLLKSDDFGKRKQAIESLNQERRETIKNLIFILKGNFSEDVKGSAATALGDYRASEAVDVLAQNIELDAQGRDIRGLLSDEEIEPVSTALEKIGNPSIPAIIQILAEKGNLLEKKDKSLEERRDIEIRVLLLKTLCRIDGDKDIVQLRLQKALKAETDSQKQARLQAALKALAENSFGN